MTVPIAMRVEVPLEAYFEAHIPKEIIMYGPVGVSIAAALVLMAGCVTGRDNVASPFDDAPSGLEAATVRVENHGLAAIAIYTQRGPTRIGTVMPGQTECVELQPFDRYHRLIARPVGGGKMTISPTFNSGAGDGWSWSLGRNPTLDRLTLVRADRCE